MYYLEIFDLVKKGICNIHLLLLSEGKAVVPIISQVYMGEYESSGLQAHVVIRRRRALGRYEL